MSFEARIKELGLTLPETPRPVANFVLTLGDLHQQQSNAASRRMHQGRLALFERIGAHGRVVCRHPLQHHGCGRPRLHPIGDRDKGTGRDNGEFGVGVQLFHSTPCHYISRLRPARVLASSLL